MAHVTFWISKDGQSSLAMGNTSPEGALTELLSQCGTDEARIAIMDGAIRWHGQILRPRFILPELDY